MLIPLLIGMLATGAQPVMFPGVPSFGVVQHTPHNAAALDAIGVKWVRISVYWARAEPKRGQYDFDQYRSNLQELWDRGMRTILILAPEQLDPAYKADVKNKQLIIGAVADFMAAAARAFKGKPVIFEIGNEPEVFPMDGYWNNPKTYTAMARLAAKRMKAADPHCFIAAVSMAWTDKPFLTSCLDAGLLYDGTIDCVSFHGYHRHTLLPESGLKEDIAWMRGQIAKHEPPNKKVILIDSERGYALLDWRQPKKWDSWRNDVYTTAEQAAYLARHYLTEIAAGIEISVWYKDMHGENGFSLYVQDKKLRPMGYVYRNLAAVFTKNPKEMRNDRYKVTLKAPEKDHCVVDSYLIDGHLVVAAWNPIEAFDGRILDNRKRIGDYYYEAWRPISPKDPVKVPATVTIGDFPAKRVRAVNLLAHDTASMYSDVPLKPDGVHVTLTPLPDLLIFDK